MNAPLLAANLGAWWLQAALLLGTGMLLPSMLRIRNVRSRLALAHSLLLAAALLPLLQPIGRAASGDVPAFRVGLLVLGDAGAAAPRPSPWGLVLGALAAVAALRLVWLAAGLVGLGRIRRRAEPLVPEPRSVGETRRLVGVDASVLESAEVAVPATAGGFRPAVLLPPGFSALPFESQRAVLCHELLHVRRRDPLAVMGEELLRSVLWFHPAVWALLSRVGLWREQAVDAEVVRLTGDRAAYLRALQEFATPRARALAPCALPFHRPGHLLRRMTLLVKETPMKRNPWSSALAGSVAAALLLGVGAVAVRAFPLAAAADDTVYKVGGDVKEPVEISRPHPKYPEEARKNRLEGQVVVEAVIDQNGRVVSARVLKSPDEMLSRASLDAVRTWLYKPATRNGKPVKVFLTVTVAFKLS